MILRTCEYCGANLDPGESCDCREEKTVVEECYSKTGTALHINNLYNAKKEETTDVIREEH